MPHDSDPTSDLPAKRPLHDATTASAAPSPRAEPAEHTLPRGAVFGHYTIEDVLGAGGMGVVYRARQERPAREVALKVIRPGFASSQALRRFELEAEVLGRLQHPGIAQVYEAGTGPGGQPFFAMELVRGEPLTRFAEARDLSTRARLELFARVCDAVQHAHTKGVIHRDLKPGNILVDSGGQPKILDFGVARLTQHDVQAVTIQTDIGQLIGTVPYMSPEQVEGDPANLDTRSDVYALGVILFELLTGRLPYDLSKKLIHEAARIIREDEPTRLSSINRTLRGDIETIALKALEKERSRRYQAASDLGSDITRFLRDEPIVARPASRAYQLRKFAQRHKALVGGVAAAFILLVAGLAGTSYGLVRAEERRREAVAAREAETAQRTIAETKQREAQTQAARAEAVNHFFNNDLLGSIDPDQSRGRDITVREVVDIAASHVTGAFTDEPEVEMRVRESIGGTYERLGASEQAREQLQRALSLAEQLHGGVSEATASIVDALARTYRLDARVPEAIQMVQRLLSIRETLNGPDDPRTIVARGDLSAYLATSRGDNAAPLDELTLRMLAGMRQKGESPAQIAAHVQQVTATITGLWKAGRRDEVFNLVRRECEPAMSVNLLRERVPLGLSGYALRLFQEGNLDGADAMATASDRIACEAFGPGHSSRLFARYVHGMMRGLLGDREECARLLEPAYREACQTLGEESDLLEQPRTNLLTVLSDLGRYEEVESIALRALDARVRHGRRDTPHTQDMRGILGDTYLRQHRAVEAEPLIVECYRSRVLEARSGRVALAAGPFSEAYFRIIALRNFQGRVFDAESLACEGLELLVKSPADGQLAIVVMKSELASIFLSEGRPDEALAIMRGTLEQSIAREGRGSKKTIMCAALLYEAYHDLHEDDHAQALLDQFGPQVTESIR